MKTYYFTPNQKERLLRIVVDPAHRAALELGFALGARVSEMLLLRVEDVDFEKGWIRVPDVKKKNRRIVPISPEVQQVVEYYIQKEKLKPRDRLFSVSDVTLNNWLRRYSKKTGIEPREEEGNLRWHSLRDSFIREHQDLPQKMLEQMTGDTIDTLQEYYEEYRPEDIARTMRERCDSQEEP
ncbi:MAG: site-specific integrase [Thermoplasmata archaeon]